MYSPQLHTYQNPRFGQWSPHFRARGHYLQRNFVVNRFRSPRPSIMQNNYEFWCETCDKGFQSLKILENHKLQHQKCNIDGCQFVAHPKIITKHIQMQHSTGLYKKIANLNNPEEVQKWREERKRKYPTKQNIEKKAAEVKEKLERGEKMGMKLAGSKIDLTLRKRGFVKEKHQGKHNNYKYRNEKSQKPPPPKRVCNIMPVRNETCKLNPFVGIQHIIIDDKVEEFSDLRQESLFEDDIFSEELTKHAIHGIAQSEPSLCGALSSLVCNYGSSDEEVISNNTTVCTSNDPSLDLKLQGSKTETVKEIKLERQEHINMTKDKSDDDSGPEEAAIKKVTENNIKDCSKNIKPKVEKRIRNDYSNVKQNKRPKYYLPSTLLVKLLHREIEQERNIILQCVRYVVKNNYFDKSNKKE